MWQFKDNVIHPNENLKNTIEKEVLIRSNDSIIKINQVLSETALSFDVPIYLLTSWISYYKDSLQSLNEIFGIFNRENESDKYNINLKTFNESMKNLERKFRDFEGIFNYYLTSTKAFAGQEKIRIKRSTLKAMENLKFIPVNLHLEQFLAVETNQNQLLDCNLNQKSCYDFTSVGAFTTVHVNKSLSLKPIEMLMISDRSFVFDKSLIPNELDQFRAIENEILLHFYSLKIFIQLSNQLIDLKEYTFHQKSEKLKKEIENLKSKLQIINRVLIESYHFFTDQNAQIARIELRQSFYNLKEKLIYLKVKFEAFQIELDNILLNNKYDKLDYLLVQIILTMIDFYNTIFYEAIPDKFNFVNLCANFSQALTALISTIDLKYFKNQNLTDLELKNLLEFHSNNGILFQVESMLSCFSNEHSMIYEHYQSLQNFNYVFIHLPVNYLDLINCSNYFISIDIKGDGFHIYMYSNLESSKNSIRVYPILINVGINEQSFTSNLLGSDLLQKFINKQSITKLISYFDNCKKDLKYEQTKLENLFYQLRSNKSFVDDARPVELLHKVAEICRLLNGLRVTNCKSGKDRTGVSVSLEQCFLLLRNHNLSYSLTQTVLDDFRRNGTRMDVVRKNVGHSKYAFNKIRYFLLPQLYRPPLELCDDLET